MKIEINIDIEAIVAEEIRKYIREYLVINNIPSSYENCPSKQEEVYQTEKETRVQEMVIVDDVVEVPSVDKIEKAVSEEPDYEYAPRKDKRRNKVEIAFHDAELHVKRRLTTEEKAKIKAQMELTEEAERKETEAAKSKIKAEELAKKLTEENNTNSLFGETSSPKEESMDKEEDSAEIDQSWSLPSNDEVSETPREEESTKENLSEEITSLFKKTEEDAEIPKADPLVDTDSIFK